MVRYNSTDVVKLLVVKCHFRCAMIGRLQAWPKGGRHREGDQEGNPASTGPLSSTVVIWGPIPLHSCGALQNSSFRVISPVGSGSLEFIHQRPLVTGWGLSVGRNIILIAFLSTMFLGVAGFSYQRKSLSQEMRLECALPVDGLARVGVDRAPPA